MSNNIVELDVRQDIREGREPFSKIMRVIAALNEDAGLRLLAPFEPVPLIRALEKRGFAHQARLIASGDWEVIFSRRTGQGTEAPRQETPAHPVIAVPSNSPLEIDARGLEPPQPMVRILEALASLPKQSVLHAKTDRRPMHLYPQLEARGFKGETEEQIDGSFVTRIQRY